MTDSQTDEAVALLQIYETHKSWPAVATFVSKYAPRNVSSALCWKVANGRCASDLITIALIRAELIDHKPPKVEVEVCTVCGEVHAMFRTCPSKKKRDPRVRRAWGGPGERAEILDRMIADSGYGSLTEYLNSLIDAGEAYYAKLD